MSAILQFIGSNRFVWIPLILAHYSFYYYLSKRNNEDSNTWKWAFLVFMVGSLGQYWALVSKYSQNLMFDGFLYDVLTIVAYFTTFAILGVGMSFNTIQWAGAVLVVVGLIMMKAEFLGAS